MILIAGPVIGMILCWVSAWFILIGLVAGILGSSIYALWITPKWRIWAYSGVEDIHQFQRSAELESLLPKNSFGLPYGIMNNYQLETLQRLMERFEAPTRFVDDPSVPEISNIYPGGLVFASDQDIPQLTITYFGITTPAHGFYGWQDMRDAKVAVKSGHRHLNRVPMATDRVEIIFLTFFCPDGFIEIPLAGLNTSIAQLDLLLYVHRGRYEQDHPPA